MANFAAAPVSIHRAKKYLLNSNDGHRAFLFRFVGIHLEIFVQINFIAEGNDGGAEHHLLIRVSKPHRIRAALQTENIGQHIFQLFTCCGSEKDIHPKNPETSTVSFFCCLFFDVEPRDIFPAREDLNPHASV